MMAKSKMSIGGGHNNVESYSNIHKNSSNKTISPKDISPQPKTIENPPTIESKPPHFSTLSIIIPCYNEKSTIIAILRAILRVNLPIDKEIIIVDDCSKDGTREILSTLPKMFPHIAFFNQESSDFKESNVSIESNSHKSSKNRIDSSNSQHKTNAPSDKKRQRRF